MRWSFRALVSGALLAGAAVLSAQSGEPRVSVAPLSHSLGVLEGDVRAFSSLFETALVKSGAFAVVKQDELEAILSAQEASLQDFADREFAVDLGKIASASHIFVGTVSKLGRSYVVSMQLVEVRTGRAIKAESAEALAPEAFAVVARRLAELFSDGSAPTVPAPAPGTLTHQGDAAESVRLRLAIGDRFMELGRYDAAVAQYEKARDLVEFDVDVLWRIVTARKQKLLGATLYSSDAIATALDVALRSDIQSFRLAPKEQIEELLLAIYTIQAIQPLLQDDVSLLLDEAAVLKVDGDFESARSSLRRAHRLDPGNPFVLAELGLLEAFETTEPERAAAGLELIREAIRRSPETALFHLYLGRSAERIHGPASAGALRAYRNAAGLAVAPDFWTARVRSFAERSLARAYYQIGALPGGVLTDRLDMPVDERLEQIEYLVARDVPFSSRTSTQNPTLYLAALSLAAGKLAQAERTARAAIPDDPAKWQPRDVPLLGILREVLAKTGTDRELLGVLDSKLKELGR